MSRRIRTLEEKDYIATGARYASEDMAKEASYALARWGRDIDIMKRYGYGNKALNAFKALIAEHAAAMKDRPAGLQFKRTTVQERNSAVLKAWEWVKRAESLLTPQARLDADLANGLMEAVPTEDSGLPAGIGALAELLEANKAALDPESGVDELLSEAPGLMSISSGPGEVKGAKTKTEEETRELNLLDGKVYIAIRDLNVSGRRAFRKLGNDVFVKEYKFHALNYSDRDADSPGEAKTAPPAK